MAGISDLGNGIGYIYVTDPSDTNDIKHNIINDSLGARAAKIYGLQAANVGANLRAYASVTISAITGVGNFTKLDVNGIGQITSSIAYTGATTTSELAALIATAVNSTTPSSGVNYTAISISNVVYLFAPASSGDSVNGDAVVISFSANATGSSTDVSGGTDSYTNEYNSRFGYRFFIDASSSAVEGTTSGTEITEFLCTRGFEGGLPIITATIASGSITIERQAAIQYVAVDTEGAAGTDNLDNINPVNFADGDIIHLLGANASRITTVTNSGNIVTQGAVNFYTADYANVITLGKQGNSWYEISKSTTAVPTASQFRTANFPLLTSSAYGSASLTAADNTIVTLTANTDKQNQEITGLVSLTTGDYEIRIPTTNAKAGDQFIIEYNANVTSGSYDVIIGGITLSAADALIGGIVVWAYYSGSAWKYTAFKNFYYGARIETVDIADEAVTVAKVESSLKIETIVIPVSWETGEQSSNKIEMPYPGTVSKLTCYLDKEVAAAATVTAKNNAGTIMTNGIMTFNALDPINTGVSVSPTANNTFVAGDILSFDTLSTTLGSGKGKLSIKITRS